MLYTIEIKFYIFHTLYENDHLNVKPDYNVSFLLAFQSVNITEFIWYVILFMERN
jgi:hypothetical protein